jgi:hypothetical protein
MESTLDLLLVGYKRIWHLYAGPFLEYESQALVILIPNVAEKNILILVEENKNNLIQNFCHIT